MDETLVLCALDLSGRPYFSFDGTFDTPRVGEFDTEMVREFFYAISYTAGINLHMKVLSGTNSQMCIRDRQNPLKKELSDYYITSYEEILNGTYEDLT